MARFFDGSDDNISLAKGNLEFTAGALTFAWIFNSTSDAAGKRIVLRAAKNDPYSNGWYFGVNGTNQIINVAGLAEITSTLADVTIANGWQLLAITKPSGTSVVRFHRYNYASPAWTHSNSVSTTPNYNYVPGTQNTWNIGSDGALGQKTTGDLAVVACGNFEASDSQIEGLEFQLSAWAALPFQGLWAFNQASVATPITDLTGGGANQTAILGTAVSATDPSGFSYELSTGVQVPVARHALGGGCW